MLLGTPALTEKQRVVYALALEYYASTGEPCSVSYVARRLQRHPATIRGRVDAIIRKGWTAPDSPAFSRLRS